MIDENMLKTFLDKESGTTFYLYLCGVKNLVEHIERLLLKHDCVIIPGFGGLVVNYESAHIVSAKNLFIPSVRKIGFNIHLTYNDGLLAQSLMKEQTCSYEMAIKQIDDYVQDILAKLKKEQRLQFGKIGTFSIGRNNCIVFEPELNSELTSQYYGLEEVYCLPGAQHAQPVTFSRFVWHAAAAIILFFMFIPVNVFDKHQAPEQAAILNFDWNKPAIIELKDSCCEIVAETLDIQQDSVFIASNQNEEVELLVSEVVEPKLIEPSSMPAKYGKTYHIIIASLPNGELAEQYLQEIKGYAFDDISIVKAESRYRVSVKGFSDKMAAESFLDEFKINYTPFSSAWIFASR